MSFKTCFITCFWYVTCPDTYVTNSPCSSVRRGAGDESFIMRFPELLMYHQQHGNCGITLKYDATLYRWMRAQIGHIRQWKLKSQISTYRKHNETRYMSALQAIGINWVPK